MRRELNEPERELVRQVIAAFVASAPEPTLEAIEYRARLAVRAYHAVLDLGYEGSRSADR